MYEPSFQANVVWVNVLTNISFNACQWNMQGWTINIITCQGQVNCLVGQVISFIMSERLSETEGNKSVG